MALGHHSSAARDASSVPRARDSSTGAGGSEDRVRRHHRQSARSDGDDHVGDRRAAGAAVRSQGRARRSRTHQRTGLFCRHRAAAGSRASQRRRHHLSGRRESGHHEDRLHRKSEGAQRHALGADGSLGRPGLQHEHVPARRTQDQQLLRANRIRRPGADARQRHQPRSEDRRLDADDPRRLDRQEHCDRRRPAAPAAADSAGTDAQGRQRLFRRRPRRRLQKRCRSCTRTSFTSSSETSKAASYPRRSISKPAPRT